MIWPAWWEWELELTPHLERRMEDRAFTELDLRAMLQVATGWRPDVVDGRFVIVTRHGSRVWRSSWSPIPWMHCSSSLRPTR
jgi:hypothetical protein